MPDRFAKIRIKYIRTFVEKQNDIKTAWDNKDIAHVNELLHKLTGSSGGYGFDKLCELSQQGMQLTSNNQVSNHLEMQHCLQNIYSILQKNYDSDFLNEKEPSI